MGTGAQVVVASVAVLVTLARLAAALCQARTDGRIAARRAGEDRRTRRSGQFGRYVDELPRGLS